MSLITCGYLGGPSGTGVAVSADFTTDGTNRNVTLLQPYWPVGLGSLPRAGFPFGTPYYWPAGACVNLPTPEALALIALNVVSKV